MKVEVFVKIPFLLFSLFGFPFFLTPLHSQEVRQRICFYNVENFFDCEDDPQTKDQEFTPGGENHWTWKRFHKKKNDLAKTIIAIGESDPPIIVGLCEVENAFVLRQLCANSPLAAYQYRYIHYDGKDDRGIDVALLYRPNRFQPIRSHSFTPPLPKNGQRTRDLLYVCGLVETDTLHCFVCHFPSKRGGRSAVDYRNTIAAYLRHLVDSLCVNNEARIIVMGDFNEAASHSPLLPFLNGDQKEANILPVLKNLMLDKTTLGTYFFQGKWEWIDHFIVSENLLSSCNGLRLKAHSVQRFQGSFLLEYTKKHMQQVPFRTYRGTAYHGGISDHLPIVLDLIR